MSTAGVTTTPSTSSTALPEAVARWEVCAVAVAEAFRGDGEILASPMGIIPSLGARLAKLTFEPDLLLSDGVASLVETVGALGAEASFPREGVLPYRLVFDVVWGGRRHVMMGASQLDRFGNQNISCIGPFERPKAQLLGVRGAPGNTLCHPTSYWVPRHTPKVFVEKVDVVSGVGNDRARALGAAGRFHALRRVVTDLCVLDFETPDGSLRLRSVHPGVTVEQVQAATGFPLAAAPGAGEPAFGRVAGAVPSSRLPTPEERALLRALDPKGLGAREVEG